MNSNDVNQIIETLCTKLGTVKEELLPEIARMHVVGDVLNTVICFVVLAILVPMFFKKYKEAGDPHASWDNRQNSEIITFITGLMTVGFFIGLWFNVYDLIAWIVSPTASAISYILTLL